MYLLRTYPAFARTFWADAVSQIGQNMLFLALPTLVLEISGDVTLTGLAFTAEIAAFALMSPWAGWLADHSHPKWLMHGANMLRATLLGLLLLAPPVWVCLLLSLGLGAAGALFSPARAAFLRRLLSGDDLQAAVALEGTSMFVMRLFSPALMGVILLVADVRLGIALDALCYVASSLILAPAWVDGPAPAGRAEAVDHDWRSGWRQVLASGILRKLLLADVLVSLLGMASWSTALAYLTEVLHVKAGSLGWLQGTMGLTGALGTRLAHRLSTASWLALLGLSYMGIPWAHRLELLVLLWAVRGLAVGGLVVHIAQALAREVPADRMGRVQAAWEQAALVACLIGSAATTGLLRWGGALWAFEVYAVAGVGLLVLALFDRVRGEFRGD